MPRYDSRAIEFSPHARKQARKRRIDLTVAERIVRSGARREDSDADWVSHQSVGGRVIEVAWDDMGNYINVKTVY